MNQHNELFIRTDSSAVAGKVAIMLVGEGEDFTYIFSDANFGYVEAEQFDVQLVCGYTDNFTKGMFKGVLQYMKEYQPCASLTVHSEHGPLIEVWND